jgi:acetyl-CoA acetyltransferase
LVTAAMMVQTGACDVALAGGVESMSNIEYYTTDMRPQLAATRRAWGSGPCRRFGR